MPREVAFVALGSNAPDATRRLADALGALRDAGELVAAVSPAVRGPYEDPPGVTHAEVPAVLDAVAEVRTARSPEDLLALCHAIAAAAGRGRDGGRFRVLDLDLLAHGASVRSTPPVLPHPRALERAFVLRPWEAVAPLLEVPGTGRTVVEHLARLAARRPEAFRALSSEPPPLAPDRGTLPVLLEDSRALAAWRREATGVVGVVPTMGALHEGHAALVRRARAECDRVLATLFVNPLQFGPAEDLARYPRTLDDDLALLGRVGADAVYAPAPGDLYPPGFSTFVVPEGPAEGLEGAVRPGHFRGVATVVAKLWLRTRPTRAYFGAKDAQQLAVVRRLATDLDLEGKVVACPTVREPDGLALSSRNRYLSREERERALALPRALEDLQLELAASDAPTEVLLETARGRLRAAGLGVDYLEIVDRTTMRPAPPEGAPRLAVATVRAGRTRLLDNRLVVRPPRERPA